MNVDKEILDYVAFFMSLIASTLAVVLACLARNLPGRGWLIASAALTLVSRPAFLIVSLFARHTTSYSRQDIYQWYEVLNLLPLFGTACFAMFLLSIWSSSRMRLDTRGLLFSFSGRIPRSVFWIMVFILFPLGTRLGFTSFGTPFSGVAQWIVWVVYAAWIVLSVWISCAVYAKRWHDCGKSGWMSLILLLPIVGALWLSVHLGFVRGAAGPNKYGDAPFKTQTA